jgi:hypothetical protein
MRLALLIFCLAAPAMAAETFSLPAGCTGIVTVQKRGCIVSHLFTCQSDPAGFQRRADMTEAGLVYLGTIDAETQWIESTHIGAGYTDRLVPGGADPASFTELLATGHDSWDFVTMGDDGISNRNVGTDDIIDPHVVIDGIVLQMTNFQIRVTDPVTGVEIWHGGGHEYIHPGWRTFLSGMRRVVTPTETYDKDNSPVEFSLPGEDGFLAAAPRFECSVPIAGLAPSVTLISATGQ